MMRTALTITIIEIAYVELCSEADCEYLFDF